MKIADSSFLVALFLPEDINHEKAKKVFEKEDLFLIPEDIVKEILTVICYKKGIKHAKEVWKLISNSDVFEIITDEYKKLVSFYISLNRKISYFDACVIYFAFLNDCEPCSFDKKLLSLWRGLRNQ